MKPRAKGVWVSESPVNPKAVQAKKDWQKEKDRLRTQRAERRERPVPNRICYDAAFAAWRPGMPLPKCNRCGARLDPNDNHKCEGFVPKYVVHDDEWRERAEARRAEQREAIHNHMDEMWEERHEYEEPQDMPSDAELQAMEEERLEEIRRENGD